MIDICFWKDKLINIRDIVYKIAPNPIQIYEEILVRNTTKPNVI